MNDSRIPTEHLPPITLGRITPGTRNKASLFPHEHQHMKIWENSRGRSKATDMGRHCATQSPCCGHAGTTQASGDYIMHPAKLYSVQKRHRVGRAGPSTLRGREWVVEVGLSWRLGRDRHNPPQRTLTLVTQWGRAPTPLQPALFFSVRLTERPVGDKISLPGVQTGADRGTRGEGA